MNFSCHHARRDAGLQLLRSSSDTVHLPNLQFLSLCCLLSILSPLPVVCTGSRAQGHRRLVFSPKQTHSDLQSPFCLVAAGSCSRRGRSQGRPPHLACFDLAVSSLPCQTRPVSRARTWPGPALLQTGNGPRCQEEPPRWKRLDELVSWAAALNSHHLAASHIWSLR